MDKKYPFGLHPQWHRSFDKIVTALLFIVAGGMLLARNLGLIPYEVFRVVFSWQMLLIVLGVMSLVKRNVTTAAILLTVGVFFMIPLVTGGEDGWFRTYWPVVFIIIGVVLLFKRRRFAPHGHWAWDKEGRESTNEAAFTEDGFVKSDVSFGGARHIVLDPVFRGADIDVSFGSVMLDLRKTSLEAPVTYMDVDCSFGSVELFIPSHWNVVMESDSTLSGCDDKRLIIKEIDYEHKLIIRGDLTFSGIVLKN